jgi:hypothetical protein
MMESRLWYRLLSKHLSGRVDEEVMLLIELLSAQPNRSDLLYGYSLLSSPLVYILLKISKPTNEGEVLNVNR